MATGFNSLSSSLSSLLIPSSLTPSPLFSLLYYTPPAIPPLSPPPCYLSLSSHLPFPSLYLILCSEQKKVCQACYLVIESYLKGDSRKNENYLARFINFFQTQVGLHTHVDIHTHTHTYTHMYMHIHTFIISAHSLLPGPHGAKC